MDFVDLSVKVDLPYPEVIVTSPNPMEAKKLMNEYGGRESETTAVMQYVYQSYILSAEYPEISKKLLAISLVEMEHHELLGETVVKLGGFPVIGGRNTFWNGSYVNYVTDVKRMLEADIQGEEFAIVNYEKTISIIQNESIKQLLRRIILDEEQHIAFFKAILTSL